MHFFVAKLFSIAVCNAVFRLSISCSVLEIFAIEVRSRPNRAKKHVFRPERADLTNDTYPNMCAGRRLSSVQLYRLQCQCVKQLLLLLLLAINVMATATMLAINSRRTLR